MRHLERYRQPDLQPRDFAGRALSALRYGVVIAALSGLGACQQGSQAARQGPATHAASVPAKANAAGTRAGHAKFNTGYGPGTVADLLGNYSGAPNFLKGHTWITLKAIQHLANRNLLPRVLNSKQNQNHLYYGTAFADWPWMGRPETPDVPVWAHWVRALDAVAGLSNNTTTSPSWSMSCPFSSNCNKAQMENVCYRNPDPDANVYCFHVPCSEVPLPEWSQVCQEALQAWPIAAYYPDRLIAGANCDNFHHPTVCGEPQLDSQHPPMFEGYDHTYDCLRSTPQSCLALSATVPYHKTSVQPVYEGIANADLNLNATAILGLGNAYQRVDTVYPFSQYPHKQVYFESPTGQSNIEILENNLPTHTNPAMLFRVVINMGGDDEAWGRELSWTNPTVKDFAMDNLYHYALSDIQEYYQGTGGALFGPWGWPHDPTTGDEGLNACHQDINNYWSNPPTPTQKYWRFKSEVVQAYEQCLVNLSPYGTSVLAYPFLAEDFANVPTEYPYLKQEALYQLQLQPVYGRASYGAPRYGAILYQFARKFFPGSPAQPRISEMKRAGNDPDLIWKTGGAYGAPATVGGADFTNLQLAFPHTYLGGNPFLCAEGTDPKDSCLDGVPTWPVFVPVQYDPGARDAFLAALTASAPPKSNRAALSYLGWASHLMQDLALPHHASNWSGYRHDAQDDFGDIFAKADAIVQLAALGQRLPLPQDDKCYVQSAWGSQSQLDELSGYLGQFEQAMDEAVTQVFGSSGAVNWTEGDIDAFCGGVELSRWAVLDGYLNETAVYRPFLIQGRTAFEARDPRKGSDCTGNTLGSPYAKNIIKNAVLGTMKLVLCAAPNTGAPLPAPQHVRATPVDRGVDLAWDKVSGAASYTVYIAQQGYSDYVVYGETTAPLLPAARNLTNGVGYSFIVVAKTGTGVEGIASEPVVVLPSPSSSATLGPSTPVWVDVQPNLGEAFLYWAPVTGAAWYDVRIFVGSPEGEPYRTVASPVNEFEWGVGNGTTIYYQVEARNSDVVGARLSETVAVPYGVGKLPAPQDFAVAEISGGVDLSWDPVPGAAKYAVLVVKGEISDPLHIEPFLILERDSTQTAVTLGLPPGTLYSLFVVAADEGRIMGGRSATISSYANGCVASPAPKLVATTEDGRVMLAWNAVPNASRYEVFEVIYSSAYPDGQLQLRGDTAGTSWTIDGLPNGATKHYMVRGRTSQCTGWESNRVTVTVGTAGLPAAENRIAVPVTGTPESGVVDLTWDPVPGAVEFAVYQASEGSSEYRLSGWRDAAAANDVNSFTVGQLTYGTSYSFAVAALDGNGVEGARGAVTVTAGNSPDLTAPTAAAEAGDGQMALGWTAVPGASTYYVWMKTEGTADFTNEDVWKSWSARTAGTSYNFTGLTNGATYYFWVQASNSQAQWNTVPISTVVSAAPQRQCPGGPTCSGHGTCANGTCACAGGYSGPDCSVTCPGGPLCSGHGTCNAGTCACAAGYSGPDCSVTCPGGPLCSGHGTCDAGTCACAAGYSGADCSVTCPGGPTCSGHGTCTGGACTCQSGYSGPDCSVTCPGGPGCSGHGTCNAGTCTCAVGYTGTSCSVNCGSGSTCPNGTTCTNNSQCATRSCVNGVCKALGCAPNCTQGTACGASGDCGSRVCTNGTCQAPGCSPNCSQGNACGINGDCGSRVCSSTTSTCQPPACSPRCNQGASCGVNGDCGSGVCTSYVCQPPACSPQCATGTSCGANADCLSKVCTNNVCAVPACSPRCTQGAYCGANGDCLSRVCISGTCRVPACSPRCSRGAACGTNNDCTSRVCNNGVCT